MPVIGDYIKIKHGYAFKGEFISTEDNNIVLVTPGNFAIGGGFKEQKCKFFTGEYPDDYVLKEDDLIVTMTDLSKAVDTLGYSALVPFSDKRVYLHNQRIGLVQFLSNEIDKHYLYWYMRTPKYQRTIAATSSGSTVHHTSPDRICEVEIEIPKMEVQKSIADFLDDIEAKININENINRNLSEQLKALFMEMFPNVTDNGGNTLGEVISFSNGKKRPESEGNVPVYGGNGILSYTDKSNAENCVIIGRVGAYCGSLYLSVDSCWISDNAIKAEAKNSKSQMFIYYLLQQMSLSNRHIGTSQPLLTQGILNAIPFTCPDKDKMFSFCENADAVQKLIDENVVENKRLVELRDSLLPKLMSGELDVSNLDI